MSDQTQTRDTYEAVEKRVRFFPNMTPRHTDFADEQRYHLDRQRRLGRAVYTPGVIDGLIVAVPDPALLEATVSPGTAIDDQGRQIVLAEAAPVDLSLLRDANQDTPVLLVIRYRQLESDPGPSSAAGRPSARWHELPQLELVHEDEAPPAGQAPRLARLLLQSDGTVQGPDLRVRMHAGLRAGGGLSIAEAAEIKGGLAVQNAVSVKGGLAVETGAAAFKQSAAVEGGLIVETGAAAFRQSAAVEGGLNVKGGLVVETGAAAFKQSAAVEGGLNVKGGLTVEMGAAAFKQSAAVEGGLNVKGGLAVEAGSAEIRQGELTIGPKSGSHLGLGAAEGHSYVQASAQKPLALNPTGGGVAIGAVAAGDNKLLVKGNTAIEGTLNVTQGMTLPSGAIVLGSTGGSHLSLVAVADYSRIQSWGSKPLALNSEGNGVAVGGTNPLGYRLHVNGDAGVKGGLTVAGAVRSRALYAIGKLSNHTFNTHGELALIRVELAVLAGDIVEVSLTGYVIARNGNNKWAGFYYGVKASPSATALSHDGGVITGNVDSWQSLGLTTLFEVTADTTLKLEFCVTGNDVSGVGLLGGITLLGKIIGNQKGDSRV